MVRVDKNIGLDFSRPLHVLAIGISPQSLCGVLEIFNIVIGSKMFIPGQRTKGPTNSLDLARFSHHQ